MVFSCVGGAQKLTHLLFADDSLLFCRANMEECNKVLDILNMYEGSSAQKVNRSKTSIFFSKSTSTKMRSSIKEALGVLKILQYDKYLGLPSLVGKGKKGKFLLHKRKGVEEIARLGREAILLSW